MNINELKSLLKKQNQKWITIGDYQFLYEKLSGKEFIKIGAKGGNTNEVETYVELLVKSIVDWKNVKVRDLFSSEVDLTSDDFKNINLDEEVKFDDALFDQFLQTHLNLVGDLFTGIEQTQVAKVEKNEKLKKK